jgi:hypothetical protein
MSHIIHIFVCLPGDAAAAAVAIAAAARAEKPPVPVPVPRMEGASLAPAAESSAGIDGARRLHILGLDVAIWMVFLENRHPDEIISQLV